MLPIEIEQKLEDIKRLIERLGAELIDISLRRSSGRSVLTVVADKKGGITLDECAEINRGLGEYFDSLAETGASGETGGFLGGSYLLEVSSPGLDRPLKTARDFERAVGETLRVVYSDDTAARTVIAKLVSMTGEELEMQTVKQNTAFRLSLSRVIKAVREISFS